MGTKSSEISQAGGGYDYSKTSTKQFQKKPRKKQKKDDAEILESLEALAARVTQNV